MARFVKIYLLILLLIISGSNGQGFAMAKSHVHFVDSNYEGHVIKGQPDGQEGSRWHYKSDALSIFINYPADHRVSKWPLKQWISLSILPLHAKRATFKFVKWELVDKTGFKIPMLFGVYEIEDSFYNNEHVAYGNPIPFYLNIPSDVQEATLNFKIEVKMRDGNVHIVEDSIPLKRVSFKVGPFDK